MPIYEYACSQCGNEFELLVRSDQEIRCPACSSKKAERLLSVPAAPQGSQKSLPMASPTPSPGCGLPQCSGGRCQFE